MGARVVEPAWPLCVLEFDDAFALRDAYFAIYQSEYVNAEVRDWAGRRVRFHAPTFEHAFSEAANYRLSAGIHDAGFSLRRARRIRWIKWTLEGNGVEIEVLAQTRQDSRGRLQRRRTVVVLDSRYVVVLEPCTDEGYAFTFVTAFPADQAYLDKIRRGGQVIERRRPKKKMPQSYGD